MEEDIILVDEHDNELGSAGKLEAHKSGKLHRAFSVFVFNSNGELLLQKRAKGKYHSGGLWSNTCCSHPRPGEDIEAAAHRRLKEEMGFDCELNNIGSFIYRVELDNGLIEHEYDHIFWGLYGGEPALNREEADGWRWLSLEALKNDIGSNPTIYTYWLKEIIKKARINFPGKRSS